LLCQAPPLFSTPHLDREGKGTKFLTFTSTALPRHRLAISQRSCQISQPVLPHYHPPRLLPLPFSGSTKVRSFSLCQVPSIFHPTSPRGAQRYEVFRFVKPFALAPPVSSPPSEGRQSYELFGICKPPYSQRPIPRSRGAQRYEVFRFVKPPFYSASLFLRERKGTKILILSRLFPFCCPARRLVKTLPG
jgi:hypothetical protein